MLSEPEEMRKLVEEADVELQRVKRMANELAEKHARVRREKYQRLLDEVDVELDLARMTNELEYQVQRNEMRVRLLDRMIRQP